MKKEKPVESESDITEERYKGPGAVVTAAGEGFVSHFKWAGVGLVLGSIGGLIFHKNVNSLMVKGQGLAKGAIESDNGFARAFGRVLRTLVGHGNASAEVVELRTEASKISGKLQTLGETKATHKEKGLFYTLTDELLFFVPRATKERWLNGESHGAKINAAATGGGLLASIGYFVVPILSAGKGTKKAHEGRRQFERAQAEILRLRSESGGQAGGTAEPTPNESVAESNTESKPEAGTTEKTSFADKFAPEKKPEAPAPREGISAPKPEASWAEGIQAQKDAQTGAHASLA